MSWVCLTSLWNCPSRSSLLSGSGAANEAGTSVANVCRILSLFRLGSTLVTLKVMNCGISADLWREDEGEVEMAEEVSWQVACKGGNDASMVCSDFTDLLDFKTKSASRSEFYVESCEIFSERDPGH